jgi:hypothetical protein
MGRCIKGFIVNGCLRGIFRLVAFVLLLVGVALVWWYRAPISQALGRLVGKRDTALPSTAADSIGAPTPGALASAQEKLQALGRARGPDSVILNGNETAALVGSGIDWTVRRSFDSLRVELLEGVLAVHARLDTRLIPKESLGPLRGLLAEREPLRIAGPIEIIRPGLARWTVKELSLRGISFPGPAVRALARQSAGADSTGAVGIRVDPAIVDARVHPSGLVLYRRHRP